MHVKLIEAFSEFRNREAEASGRRSFATDPSHAPGNAATIAVDFPLVFQSAQPVSEHPSFCHHGSRSHFCTAPTRHQQPLSSSLCNVSPPVWPIWKKHLPIVSSRKAQERQVFNGAEPVYDGPHIQVYPRDITRNMSRRPWVDPVCGRSTGCKGQTEHSLFASRGEPHAAPLQEVRCWWQTLRQLACRSSSARQG